MLGRSNLTNADIPPQIMASCLSSEPSSSCTPERSSAYQPSSSCPINGRCFFVIGGEVHLFQPFPISDKVEKDGRWTVPEVERQPHRLAHIPTHLNNPLQ
jgi:hypothetical protein